MTTPIVGKQASASGSGKEEGELSTSDDDVLLSLSLSRFVCYVFRIEFAHSTPRFLAFVRSFVIRFLKSVVRSLYCP